MINIPSFVVVIAATGIGGCSTKDDDIVVPKQHIVGKWETVQLGNWPDMIDVAQITGYTEFTSDSVMRFYDYDESAFTSQSTYWLTDTLLVESVRRPDGVEIRLEKRYDIRRGWMRLEIVGSTSIVSTSVLQKLN